MLIIEIQPQENGAHRNQKPSGDLRTIPAGWAVVPDSIEIPDTFPFVNIEVEDGVVTSMTAGVVSEPEPEPTPAPTQLDRLESQITYTAMMTDTLIPEVTV